MGDFNSQPFSIPIHMMRLQANMSDSFLDVHPNANNPPASMDPHTAIKEYGMSCDSPLCSWSHGKPIPPIITNKGGKRLDYIFYRQPAMARRPPLIWGYRTEGKGGGGFDDDGWPIEDARLEKGKNLPQSVASAPQLRCVKSEVVMTDNVPGRDFSYSDHFGLFSTFTIDSPDDSANVGSSRSASQSSKQAIGGGSGTSFTPLVPLMEGEAEPLTEETMTFAPIPPSSPSSSPRTSTSIGAKSSTIRNAINILRQYTPLSQRTAKLHFRLFGGMVFGLIALTIGSAWQPKSWLQPIFTLLGGAMGAAGATLLYTGFVWGKWELGLLTETMEEMELELRVVEMEERGR